MNDKIIAQIAINKIIKAMQFHRNRMNIITDFGFGLKPSMSQEFIRAYYILHYPKEHIDGYCQFALAKITRKNPTTGIIYKNLLEAPTVQYFFNKMIKRMHKNWILYVGW